MKKIACLIGLSTIFFSCEKKDGQPVETILKGKTSVLVDESLLPIVEDQVAVFENEYDAEFTLIPRSEAAAFRAFVADSSQIAILARTLTDEEKAYFKSKERYPKITELGKDAVVFISNRRNADTLIDLERVVSVLKGSLDPQMPTIVFDNPNSGTVRYLLELSDVKALPSEGVYSMNGSEAVISYVSENVDAIGVVGINWLYQPTPTVAESLKSVRALAVKGLETNGYFMPNQNNLATGEYPLARDLFLIDNQGRNGLGIGLASFIAGDRGQRIMLKSGLLPVRIPPRKIVVKPQSN